MREVAGVVDPCRCELEIDAGKETAVAKAFDTARWRLVTVVKIADAGRTADVEVPRAEVRRDFVGRRHFCTENSRALLGQYRPARQEKLARAIAVRHHARLLKASGDLRRQQLAPPGVVIQIDLRPVKVKVDLGGSVVVKEGREFAVVII
jgi:hypothetical protein